MKEGKQNMQQGWQTPAAFAYLFCPKSLCSRYQQWWFLDGMGLPAFGKAHRASCSNYGAHFFDGGYVKEPEKAASDVANASNYASDKAFDACAFSLTGNFKSDPRIDSRIIETNTRRPLSALVFASVFPPKDTVVSAMFPQINVRIKHPAEIVEKFFAAKWRKTAPIPQKLAKRIFSLSEGLNNRVRIPPGEAGLIQLASAQEKNVKA